ncbi:hydantoinase B/oxoprolinase family protein, partial [Streptosporangium sp. NPDC050280]
MTERLDGAGADGARLDGATAEVVRSYLLAAAEEMRATLIRTSFNPVIYEVHDFGMSMYDADLRLIAEATGLTFFLGANDFSLRKGVEYVGRENLRPGDVVLLNYPYWNAAHAYDATLFCPVFMGADLVGFLCVRAHWMDLGAKDPGYVLDSTDM